ncbi:hypothetical protein [Burkholderia metallica]|uniref:hypothetical protein n=1 Tax=Burkholderia metallica TaxID=488729 RepID=UPI00131CE151|nr:hypothetical protein [Burkholderia metallica]
MEEIRLDAYPPAVPAEMDAGVYRVAGAGRLTSPLSQPIVSWKLLIQIVFRLHETGNLPSWSSDHVGGDRSNRDARANGLRACRIGGADDLDAGIVPRKFEALQPACACACWCFFLMVM